jgi:hypothetical protein
LAAGTAISVVAPIAATNSAVARADLDMELLLWTWSAHEARLTSHDDRP